MGLNEADNRVKNIAIKFMAKNIPFIRYFYTKAMLVIWFIILYAWLELRSIDEQWLGRKDIGHR